MVDQARAVVEGRGSGAPEAGGRPTVARAPPLPPWSARPWSWRGKGQRRPRGQGEAGGARSGRPDFGSGQGGSVGGGSGHADGEAGRREAGGGGSGHADVEAGQREAGGGESRRGEAGGARSGRPGVGSGRGG
ncbi:hypothetical protein GUJ93_ZPchr0011g27398 [Zizania palustris]|uniref:Uncharacterized protein n=1 Tax=Zizania palustris TaxID=103762 RepID=A0A8J5WH10_ZIZPA|nr:hypothetical protein GUJ93_ZPchr0011g27398 [Zizania palustris]